MVANTYSVAELSQMFAEDAPGLELPAEVLVALASLQKTMDIAAREAEGAAGAPPQDARGKSYASSSGGERRGARGGERRGAREDDGWTAVPARGAKCAPAGRPGGSGGDWAAARGSAGGPAGFRPTKIDAKDGVERDIGEVRMFLNKISNKNYEKQRDAIVAHITAIVERGGGTEAAAEDLQRIAQFVFDIASTNKFLSEVYADLYRALVERFAVFEDILELFVVAYTDTATALLYVDPAVDYDGFCLYTKTNDCRKATASFIVMLMLRGVLARERVAGIIEFFLRAFMTYIEQPDRGNEIEEIAEALFVFITVGKTSLKGTELWKAYLAPTVAAVAQMKPRALPSLTNRAVFKFMDIMDKVRV